MGEGPEEIGPGGAGEELVIELAESFSLSVKGHLIDRGLGVLGMRGSGKSYTCGVLAEELAKIGQPFVIADIMGEYYTLREHFPILITALGEREYADIRGLRSEHAPELARKIVELGLSAVLDLSRATMAGKLAFLADFLEAFYETEEEHRRPYVLIVDEAHRIAPEKGLPRLEAIAESQKKASYWLYEIAATGRHHGIGFVVAIRRPAEISKAILTQAEVKIVHKLVDPTDLKRLFEEGLPRELADSVRNLKPGEAVVLGLGEPRIVKIKERMCSHGGRTPLVKPAETPDLLEAIRALAKALGLEASVGEVGLPRRAVLPAPEQVPPPTPVPPAPKAPAELPSVEFDVRKFGYPADVVAGYHVRLLTYGATEKLVPTPGHVQEAVSFFLPDREALDKLVLGLASRGWELENVRAGGRKVAIAAHGAGELRAGLVASEAEGKLVLTLVISTPEREALRKALAELEELVMEMAPGAKKLGERRKA